jgi:probable phosphoglycerate mutase
MELVLVRHAEPDWEPGGRAVDHPRLTGLGREQARRTARVLAKESFDGFYVSPLRRALETAEPIAEALGLEPRVAPWLSEFELPSLEGRTVEEVQAFFHAARVRHLEKWWDGFPGGEAFRHFYQRTSAGIEKLLTEAYRLGVRCEGRHRLWQIPDPPPRILVVAHEGTCSVILSHLLGIEPVPWAWLRFSITCSGIARLGTTDVADGAVWVLRSFNQVEHLRGLEAS